MIIQWRPQAGRIYPQASNVSAIKTVFRDNSIGTSTTPPATGKPWIYYAMQRAQGF